MNHIARVMAGVVLCGAAWASMPGVAGEPAQAPAQGTRVSWGAQRRVSVRATEGWYRTQVNAKEFMGQENPGQWAYQATVLLYTGPGGPPPGPDDVRIRVLLNAGEYPSAARGFETAANPGKILIEKLQYRPETIYPGGLPVDALRSPMRDRTRFFVVVPLGFDVAAFVADMPRPDAGFPDAVLKLSESLNYSLGTPEAQDPPPPPRRSPGWFRRSGKTTGATPDAGAGGMW